MLNLRSKHSVFVPNAAIFILERNLIGADFDHVLGNHFWGVSASHAINKATLYIVIFAKLHLNTWLPLSLKLTFPSQNRYRSAIFAKFCGSWAVPREKLQWRQRKYCGQKSVKFGGQIVRLRSSQASDDVARGRLVSLEGFSFAFRAKHWCLGLHLEVLELNGRKNRFHSDQPRYSSVCAFLLHLSKEQSCLLCTKVITKKHLKRKLTKACLNLELIAGKEIKVKVHFWQNCADKNETVVRKIPPSSKVELFPAPLRAETNTFLPATASVSHAIYDIPSRGFNRKSRFVEHGLTIRPQGISRGPRIG